MRAEAIVGVVIVLVTLSIGSILWLSSGSDEVASLGVDKSTFEMKDTGPAGLAGDAAGFAGGFGFADQRGGDDSVTAEPSGLPAKPVGGPETGRRADLVIPEVQAPARRTEAERMAERESRPAPTHSPGVEPRAAKDVATPAQIESEKQTEPTKPTAAPVTGAPEAEIQNPVQKPAGPKPAETTARPVEPPARETSKPVAPTPPAPVTYKIQTNDTLIAIAREHYDDGALWRAIKIANPGLDESRLQVGRTIGIPPLAEARRLLGGGAAANRRTVETKPAAAGEPRVARATYIVGRGDSLSSIARNVLGKESRWREIYELNRDKLKSPDVVPAGTELRLPADASEARRSSRG